MGPERVRVSLPAEDGVDSPRSAEVLGGSQPFQNHEQEVVREQGKPVSVVGLRRHHLANDDVGGRLDDDCLSVSFISSFNCVTAIQRAVRAEGAKER